MEVKLTLPALHPAQRKVFDCEARFIVCAAGRRFGKTRLGALKCVVVASAGKRAWWIAPTYAQAAIGWSEIRRLVNRIPGVTIRESERLVTLPSGGWIQIKSADTPNTLRGPGLDFVVLDEAAFMKPETWGEVMRPALADRKGRALLISTPYGRNWFWHMWQAGLTEGGETKAFRYPTSSNPYIARDEILAAQASTSERIFREEWQAEFTDDSNGVFRNVRAAAYQGIEQPGGHPHTFRMGVDLAQSNDFSVLTVLDVDSFRVVDIDRFNQVSWKIQRTRIEAMYRKWLPKTITVEANSIGTPNIEELHAAGLPVKAFTTTSKSKGEIIDGLVFAFETGRIALPSQHPLYEILVGELEAYEMERLPSGNWRYSAPPGMHDDCVMSLALAWSVRGPSKLTVEVMQYR